MAVVLSHEVLSCLLGSVIAAKGDCCNSLVVPLLGISNDRGEDEDGDCTLAHNSKALQANINIQQLGINI